jgi:hypothetical protein
MKTNDPEPTKPLTIADRFEEARKIFREERYQLPRRPRRDARPNAFVALLIEESERSK